MLLLKVLQFIYLIIMKLLMKVYQFAVIIEQDNEGMYMARVPDLPGCHTQAKTLPQLYKRIEEAIELSIDICKEKNTPIPQMKFVGVQQIQISV